MSKGQVAERVVAKLLAEWWAAVDPSAQFIRTPLSGGWGTPTTRQGFRASGDIMTTSASFPFTVESKRREAWCPRRFVLGKASPVWGWWCQAVQQAVELSAEPMMWMRRNAAGGVVAPPWTVVVRGGLVAELGLPAPDVLWTPDELAGVETAGVHPVAYLHPRLLGVSPDRFVGVEAKGWQSDAGFRREWELWLAREQQRKAEARARKAARRGEHDGKAKSGSGGGGRRSYGSRHHDGSTR